MKESIEQIWQKAKPAVLKRILVLEEAVTAGFSGAPEPEVLRLAVAEAHRLHGTLGSFGYPRASRFAGQIEAELPEMHNPEQAYSLSMLLHELRESLEQAPEHGDLELVAQRAKVWFVGQPGASLDVLRSHPDLELVAEHWLAADPPDLVIFDSLVLPALAETHRRFPEVPVLVLTEGEVTDQQRLEALQAGALRLLPLESEPEGLLEEAWRLAHLQRIQASVLALDDDLLALKVLGRMLLNQGVKLETVSRAQDFWDSLNRSRPDIVLLDLEMPEYSGQEICQLLRASPSTEDIPVIVITATRDPEILEELYAIGVDDCLSKPLGSRALWLRVRNRLERVQAIRRHALQEPETGAWSLDHGKPLSLRLMRLAERTQSSFALAVVKLDQPGRQEAVLRISRSLRAEDLVCRWRDENLLLGLYGSKSSDAMVRLKSVFHELQADFDVKGWVGLAEFPSQGNTFELLVERAGACLEVLLSQPGPAILSYGDLQRGDSSLVLDVVLVEDDALLGEVILHSLTSRNLTCRWLQNGDEAMRLLSGQIPSLRPRVVLLDVDLPGASGLEILRQLKTDGALRRTRVMMLTVRSNEAETLETLSLGAYDHIAKPCSLQVLMQRIRQALHAP